MENSNFLQTMTTNTRLERDSRKPGSLLLVALAFLAQMGNYRSHRWEMKRCPHANTYLGWCIGQLLMNNLDQQRKRDPKLALPDSHSHRTVS